MKSIKVTAAMLLTTIALVGCSNDSPPTPNKEQVTVETKHEEAVLKVNELTDKQVEHYEIMKQALPAAKKIAATEDGPTWVRTLRAKELGLSRLTEELYFGVWSGKMWGSEFESWTLQSSAGLDDDSIIYNSEQESYYIYTPSKNNEGMSEDFKVGVEVLKQGVQDYKKASGEWPSIIIVDRKGLKIGNDMFEEGEHDVFVELPASLTYMGIEFIEHSPVNGPRVFQIRNNAMETAVYYFEEDRVEYRSKRKIVE